MNEIVAPTGGDFAFSLPDPVSELATLQEQLKATPMPSKVAPGAERKAITSRRRELREQIKSAKETVQTSKPELLDGSVREKTANLARKIGYPNREWEKMSPVEYDRENNMVRKMARLFYAKYSETGSELTIQISRLAESHPLGEGAHQNVAENRPAIKDALNDILVEMGADGYSPEYALNPYVKLAAAILLPIGATFLDNYHKKKLIEEGGPELPRAASRESVVHIQEKPQ